MDGEAKQGRQGIVFALIAFAVWILFPFYWNQLRIITPMEILCHRIIWSIPVLYLIMMANTTTDQIVRPGWRKGKSEGGRMLILLRGCSYRVR